jgi:ribulose-phosphate 3-epimerase
MGLEHKIAPSILSADFARLGDEVRRVEEAGADLIHFDVMDGHFVPNLSIGVPVLKSLRKITRLPLDAHLMISEPARYLKAFVEAGANSISVHAEVCDDLPMIAARIHELGARASRHDPGDERASGLRRTGLHRSEPREAARGQA